MFSSVSHWPAASSSGSPAALRRASGSHVCYGVSGEPAFWSAGVGSRDLAGTKLEGSQHLPCAGLVTMGVE